MPSSHPDLPSQRRYYDRLWAEIPAARLNSHERARREVVERALKWLSSQEPPPWSIAEVGCGRGWLSGLVLSAYGEVLALDLSPDSIAKARETFPHVRWEARSIFDAPLPTTHDLVVSSEVIEHVTDQRAFVERLVSAIRPRGWLLVTTPNARVARDYQLRPDFRPQPIENLLETSALAALLEPTCDVVHAETFFFGQGDGPLHRLARASRVRALRSRSQGRDPFSRFFSRARLGLYTMVLARRRT
jgi:2-polyprenyl-3-methyl-5-hydroxy-6-metoxy-1,4-benzoquinol methylase